MKKLKNTLAITVPIAILILLWALFKGNSTIGVIALIYVIVGGIIWKFVKHTN